MTVIIISSTIVVLKVITIILSLIIEVDGSVTRDMLTRWEREKNVDDIYADNTVSCCLCEKAG